MTETLTKSKKSPQEPKCIPSWLQSARSSTETPPMWQMTSLNGTVSEKGNALCSSRASLAVRFLRCDLELGLRVANPAWLWDSQPRMVGTLGCKNLGESNFHMENGLREAQKLPNRYYHISRSQGNLSEFFFVHYWGCGRHFSGGDRSDLLKRG